MHITVKTSILKSVLETISRVSTKHLTLPVLQCVYIEVVEGIVALRATNLEIGIEGKVEAVIKTDGVVAVPAQVFLQTINLISEEIHLLEHF